MLFHVVPAFLDGRPRTRDELRVAEAKLGLLVISDWREGHRSGRALRVANLYVHNWSQPAPQAPRLIHPLFDPELIRCDRRGMVLAGWEIGQGCDGERHFAQQWWLRADAPA